MSVSRVNSVSFKGMAIKAPVRKIRNAQDAIAQWELLKHPQFTNVFQESEEVAMSSIRENKAIRDFNYSFLDKLVGTTEKKKFIEKFKIVTGFPSLKVISKNMIAEFNRVMGVAGRKVGHSYDEVLLTGYDKFCSVGLGTALPGSDMDKGYTIIRGVAGDLLSQQKHSLKFKGAIWDNIDNRIVSVNHCAAFPNVMTDKELALSLNKFDVYADDFVNDKNMRLFLGERMQNPNPVSGAKFNIWLSERISSRAEKEEAKNLAYIVEAIRDGAKGYQNERYLEQLNQEMNNSKFAWCSNVGQGYVMQLKYDLMSDNVVKPKLKARKEVEQHFDSWNVDKQYDLVKDIIRSMSGDNKNPEFNELFYAKTDKHRLLINDILKGDVDCAFEFRPDGAEETHLFLKTTKAMHRYYNFNVYKMDY